MAIDKALITAQVLAEALDLSVETIWRYTREKKIPYVELGTKQYRYQLNDVIQALTGSVVQEKAADYQCDPAKKLTYQDYLSLPEEPGFRFEILDGLLIKEPSPNVKHQRVTRRLLRLLEDYFWEYDPDGEVFVAPLDVTFQDVTVVQPDIFYISGERKHIVKTARIDGVPDLIVEIISPSNSRKDRLQKLQIYQRARVQHYLLVDPEEKTFECFLLQGDKYVLLTAGMDEDVMTHPDFNGLTVDLKNLW